MAFTNFLFDVWQGSRERPTIGGVFLVFLETKLCSSSKGVMRGQWFQDMRQCLFHCYVPLPHESPTSFSADLSISI